MGDTAGPDRSSVEVKALLRKLDPKTGSSHKDRVRLLNRVRHYAEGGGGGKGDVSVMCSIIGCCISLAVALSFVLVFMCVCCVADSFIIGQVRCAFILEHVPFPRSACSSSLLSLPPQTLTNISTLRNAR